MPVAMKEPATVASDIIVPGKLKIDKIYPVAEARKYPDDNMFVN
jgi:hypothetical protein